MRSLRSFKSMLVNGFTSIWRNKAMGFISILTIFAVMLIMGILLLGVLNINNYVNNINQSLDKIVVYFNDDASFKQIDNLMEKLSKREELKEIVYISKDQAMVDAKEMFKDKGFVLNGIEKNPLPSSMEIKVSDIAYAEELVKELENNKLVEDSRYFQDWINRFIKIDRAIKIGSFVSFIIIVSLCVFVISNIIKVAISSRGTEIEIMKIVGASESYIKGPFIMEGLFYSLLGAVLALLAIFKLYEMFIGQYGTSIYEYLSFTLVDMADIKSDLISIFIAISLGIGTIGSIASLRKYLKV